MLGRIDTGSGSGSDGKKMKVIKAYKGKEIGETHDRQYSEGAQHIEGEGVYGTPILSGEYFNFK